MHSYRSPLCSGRSGREAYHVIHQEHIISNTALLVANLQSKHIVILLYTPYLSSIVVNASLRNFTVEIKLLELGCCCNRL
jgi:hypothetical protein